MLISVEREYKASATPGRLFINGNFFCHTLELPRFRCIPEGEYPIRLTHSPRFGRIMPLVDRVPDRDGIRIHWGNFIKDSSGCLLVGYDKGVDAYGVDAIFRSKKCFDELFKHLEETREEIRIEFKSVSLASVE